MTVSFKEDIAPLFRRADVACMAARGVLLDDYAYMSDSAGNHAHAAGVRAALAGTTASRMPPGGPYWTQQMLDLLDRWMADGYLA